MNDKYLEWDIEKLRKAYKQKLTRVNNLISTEKELKNSNESKQYEILKLENEIERLNNKLKFGHTKTIKLLVKFKDHDCYSDCWDGTWDNCELNCEYYDEYYGCEYPLKKKETVITCYSYSKSDDSLYYIDENFKDDSIQNITYIKQI